MGKPCSMGTLSEDGTVSKSGARRWVFTWNHWTDECKETLQHLHNPEKESSREIPTWAIKFLMYQEEQAPSTGTLHLQGFLVLTERVSLVQLRKYLTNAESLPSVYLAPMRGSIESNIKYVTKSTSAVPDTIVILGKQADKMPRELTIFQEVQHIAKHKTIGNELAHMVERRNILMGLAVVLRPNHRPGIKVDWYYGPAGTGKSHAAYDAFGATPTYRKECNTKWWQGYLGEEHVVMDELRFTIRMSHLLVWWDEWPLSIEIKNGELQAQWTHVIVTTNFSPKQWATRMVEQGMADPEDVLPFKRRLNEIRHFIRDESGFISSAVTWDYEPRIKPSLPSYLQTSISKTYRHYDERAAGSSRKRVHPPSHDDTQSEKSD